MMKKKILLILSVICCLFFCSCVKSIELSERALVQAVGIDVQGDGYLVTIQYFSPENGGGQALLDVSKSNNYVISCYGNTLTEALSKAEQKQGKSIFFIHNKLLVIGRQAAQQGINYLTEYFTGKNEIKGNLRVCISQTTAKEVVSAPLKQGILPADAVDLLLQTSYDSGQSARCELIAIARSLTERDGDVVIPVVSIEKEEEEQLAVVYGMAFFGDYKLQRIVEVEGSMGYCWLLNNVRNYPILIHALSYPVTLSTVETKTKVGKIKNYTVEIKVDVTSVVSEIDAEDFITLNKNDLEILEQEQRKIILEDTKTMIDLSKELGIDFLGVLPASDNPDTNRKKMLNDLHYDIVIDSSIRQNNHKTA